MHASRGKDAGGLLPQINMEPHRGSAMKISFCYRIGFIVLVGLPVFVWGSASSDFFWLMVILVEIDILNHTWLASAWLFGLYLFGSPSYYNWEANLWRGPTVS